MTASDREYADDIRPLVRRIGKPPQAWRRADLTDFAVEHGVRVVNLRYPSLDGKLRELRCPVNSRSGLDRLLAAGERVDGSSLFPGYFSRGASDLYAVPVYRWAFLNPWAADELDVVCRFAGPDGRPAPTPDNVLAGCVGRLREARGVALKALAELEFYLILERTDERFPGRAQRAYHQSAPYLHGRAVADEILRAIATVTGAVKYGHAEVGYIDRLESPNPELSGRRLEQYEIEFDLMPVEDLGCWLTVARWLIRAVADRHGASATFAPKLEEGMAGSGLHLHLALERGGVNLVRAPDGGLSPESLALVGGLLGRAASLTAFGNTVAASYLRLVPGQEAPTRLFWGRGNRASLLRIPLDFATETRLDREMNPAEEAPAPAGLARPTIELRSPDGSAFPHLLLAAVVRCIEAGLADPAAPELARRLELDGRPGEEAPEGLDPLPGCAGAAARALRAQRSFYEEGGFPPGLLDLVAERLEAEADDGLADRLRTLPEADRLAETRRILHKDLHKH